MGHRPRSGSLTGVFLLVLAGCVGVPAVPAAAAPRQTMDMTFSNTRPGAPTGATLKVDWLGDNPGEKPHSITDDVFSFARGSKFDFSVPKRCKATNAQLERHGASACPKASKVAGGEIDLDLGKPTWLIPRVIKTHVTVLNGGGGVLIDIARATNIPFPLPIRVVDRAPVEGTSITTENPPTPGFPPPDRFVAVKRDRIYFKKIVEGSGDNRRGFLTTPGRCPSGGEWVNTGTFHYHDGITQHISSPSPCVRRRGSLRR
jgi:hypothetical protein